jgi:hypothetical protein
MSSGDNKAEIGQCPLCKNEVPVRAVFPEGEGRFTLFQCERCGEFGSDKQCILALRDSGPHPLLSGVARQMAEAGETLRGNLLVPHIICDPGKVPNPNS